MGHRERGSACAVCSWMLEPRECSLVFFYPCGWPCVCVPRRSMYAIIIMPTLTAQLIGINSIHGASGVGIQI